MASIHEDALVNVSVEDKDEIKPLIDGYLLLILLIRWGAFQVQVFFFLQLNFDHN
jgi:hypothetical protein